VQREQHVAWAEYRKTMQSLALGIPTRQSELDLPQTDDIRINDLGPVMRAAGDEIELAQMRFGFPPSGPRKTEPKWPGRFGRVERRSRHRHRPR
jgi:hypothetical protein